MGDQEKLYLDIQNHQGCVRYSEFKEHREPRQDEHLVGVEIETSEGYCKGSLHLAGLHLGEMVQRWAGELFLYRHSSQTSPCKMASENRNCTWGPSGIFINIFKNKYKMHITTIKFALSEEKYDSLNIQKHSYLWTHPHTHTHALAYIYQTWENIHVYSSKMY